MSTARSSGGRREGSPLLRQAIHLAEKGARDPIHAVKHGAKLMDVLHELNEHEREPAGGDLEIPQGPERGFDFPLAALGCTHIIRVTAIDPTGIAPTMTTPTLKVEWPGGVGVVRSLYAGTMDGLVASLSSVSLRVTVNGTDDLFTDGEDPAFVPLVTFQAQNHNWFRLKDRKVTAQQRWTVQLMNENLTGGNIIPFVLFGYARISDG